ncbi:hypothetical protein A3G55_03600 [Candidatus Giovannonibacteria bacterium RIFCSPLOWO2_12_FULL_44_25]|uniref:Uncharacterized protein n=2 Tax=Candidatus Giovannoniibacteriota TaxID=1752738 RepID=A0A1F5WBN9_9BACT|nr:MAG: hypothetical protein UW15_C0027G0008 [Parcubacteria group bacterium GW2011_GWC1_44_10]KKT59749.1 MAG: hypothetical protein UW53_C0008G0032 [Candidatus Giovannonibacteria bacterium GW2011_GWA1_44_25]KKU29627.1 MAG: hypothetical protein UX43_C0008G0032 [Candidatus Giovannonibacteria bacterium GW2011_GWB1_46_20]OGF50337.1 MAG: hypothetical protein A2120_02070 [Candidatus Giovannonibacteria bacterium GWA2_45_15]OGF60143.1 MAG: hypothetical protein A2W40_00935 [Candidatus Giovannonibacteria 
MIFYLQYKNNLTLPIVAALEDLPLKRKVGILKSLVFAVIAFMTVYIYLVGLVVAQNSTRENLNQTLEKILILTSHTENALIKENTEKGMEYFIAAGYEKPKKLEMIEKISNVAANY